MPKDPVLSRLIDTFVESLRPDQAAAIVTKLRPDQEQAFERLIDEVSPQIQEKEK